MINNSKDNVAVSIAEEFSPPKFAMTFKGFDVDKGEGTFGFGTNKQKAISVTSL